MKTLHACVAPFLAFALSACFMSSEPRIETGVMLADGPVSFCIPDDPPCSTGYVEGDGYVVASEDENEEAMRLRFEVLTEVNGVPIYLGEAELREGEDSAWVYILARDAGEGPEGPAQFYIQMPDCDDMDEDVRARSGVTQADAYTCMISDLPAFRAYLVEAHKDDFTESDFWTANP